MLFKYKRLLLACVALFVLITFCAAVMVYKTINDFKSSPAIFDKQVYSLKYGENATKVIEDFSSNPITKQINKIYLHFHTEYTAVQKGDYLVDGKKSLLDLLKDMVQGNVVQKIYPTFPIIEGTNYAKIMRSISKRKTEDKTFFKLIKEPRKLMVEIFSDDLELLEFIGGPRENFEGLISPATYPMYEKNPYMHMFRKGMLRQARILKKYWNDREESEFIKTPYDALIMASLIERETFLDDERPIIASVFYNRLNRGMRLQTDPSVMYGVNPIFIGRLSKVHLLTDTPYNTYTRSGLPPTPICMPREQSIYAVLHPSKTDYLFFVAKSPSPKDGHAFSSNLRAHNRAVIAYRKNIREFLVSQHENADENDELLVAEEEANASAVGEQIASIKNEEDNAKSEEKTDVISVEKKNNASVEKKESLKKDVSGSNSKKSKNKNKVNS